MNGYGAHSAATEPDQAMPGGVPGPWERQGPAQGRAETRDGDVLTALIRGLRQLEDAATVGDPRTALGIFVDHLVPVVADELQRRGWRRSETLAERLRPLSFVGSAFAGALVVGLIVAVVALVVWQATS